MASQKERQELWVRFACAAVSNYTPPDSIEEDELIEDMVNVSSGYADAMLDEYDGFDAGGGRKKKKSRRRKDDEDEEEEEEEDEDE